MRVINATPHPLDVYERYTERVTVVPTSEHQPRLEEAQGPVREFTWNHGGIAVNTAQALVWKMDTLPREEDGVFYVVSRTYAIGNGLLPHPRRDLVVPGPAVRNTQGKQIGCYGLSRFVLDFGAQGPLAR